MYWHKVKYLVHGASYTFKLTTLKYVLEEFHSNLANIKIYIESSTLH